MMRVHYLQHVPFEGLGSLEGEFTRRGYGLNPCHLYAGDPLPELEEVDWLVVMGGPMNIDDHSSYPWLQEEKAFIARAISAGKRVLGICLGAQLMASALGATVTAGRHREIGWFPVYPTDRAGATPWGPLLSEPREVFHWHGDTFAIPDGADHLAYSDACANQAFAMGTRVLGLQFHLETTAQSAAALIEHCGDELDASTFVQPAERLQGSEARFAQINGLMTRVVDTMAG